MSVTFVTISQAIEALLTLAEPYDLGSAEVDLLRSLPSSLPMVKGKQNTSAFLSTAKLLERLVGEGKRRKDDETAETAHYILYQLYTRIVTPHRLTELSALRRSFMESSLTTVRDPTPSDFSDETTDENVVAGFAARLARNIRLEGTPDSLRLAGVQLETQSGKLIIQVVARETATSTKIPMVTNAASILAYLGRHPMTPPLNRVEIQLNHHGTFLVADRHADRWGVTPETFGPLAIDLFRRLFGFEGAAEWIYDAKHQTGTVRLFSSPEEGFSLKAYSPLDVEQTLSLCPDLQNLNLEDNIVFTRTDAGRVVASFLNTENHIVEEVVEATKPYAGRLLGVVEKKKKQVVGVYIGHSTRLTEEERGQMLRSLELTVHHVGRFDRLILIYGTYEGDRGYVSDHFEREPDTGRFTYVGSDQPVPSDFVKAPLPLLSENFRANLKEKTKGPLSQGVGPSEAPLSEAVRVMDSHLAAYLMEILPDVLFREGMRAPPFIGGGGISADGKILFLDLDGGYPTMPILWAVATHPLIRTWHPQLEKIRIQRVHTRGMYPFGFLSIPVRGSTSHPAEFDRVDSEGKALSPSLFNNPTFDLGKYLAEKINEEGGHLEVSRCQLVPNHHGYTAVIELASLPVASDGSPFLPVDMAHYFSRPQVRMQLPYLGEVEVRCQGKILYRFVWQGITELEQIAAIPFGMTQIPGRLATWESARAHHPARNDGDTIWTGFVMDRLHPSTLHRAVVDEVVHALQWKGALPTGLESPIQPKDVHVSRISSKDKNGFVLRVVVAAPLGISQFELEEKWGRLFRHPFDSLFRMEGELLQGIDLFRVRAVGGEPEYVNTYVAAGAPILEDNNHLRVGRFFERTSPFDARTMYRPPIMHKYLPFETDLTRDPNHDALVSKKMARLATEVGSTLENLEGLQEDRLIVFLNAGSLAALRERLADRQTDNLENPLSFHTLLNHAMGGIHLYTEGIIFTEPGATTALLFEPSEGHYFYSGPVGFRSPPANGGEPVPRPPVSHLTVVGGHGGERSTHHRNQGHPLRHQLQVVSRDSCPVMAGGEVMATGEAVMPEAFLTTLALE